MNNNNQEIKSFVNWLMSLSPLEFTTLAVMISYIISCNLTVDEQNSFGNWFELVGQIMLTFNAQGSNQQFSLSEQQYRDILNRLDELSRKINSNNY